MDRVHIESLDVLKAQGELITRRDNVFVELGRIKEALNNIQVFPSLLWTWVYDVMSDIYENEQYKDLAVNDYVDEAVPSGVTLKQIFDKFYDDVDSLDINMDQGGEILEEIIRDWMRDNDFLVSLDIDGGLDNE